MAHPEEIGLEIQSIERYLGILSQIGRLIDTSPNMTPAYGEDDPLPYGVEAISTKQSVGEPLVELFMYSHFPSEKTRAFYRVAVEPSEYANLRLPGRIDESIPSRRIYYIQKDGRIELIEEKYSTEADDIEDDWVEVNVLEDLSLTQRRDLEEELQRLPRIE